MGVDLLVVELVAFFLLGFLLELDDFCYAFEHLGTGATGVD
jgi:hypothetical protein